MNQTPEREVIDLIIARTFNAPRELVWQAWTEPEMLMNWICPHGFTVLFARADLREGGEWSSGMKHSDGDEYVMKGVYREIDPPRRLVMTHVWEDDTQPGHDPKSAGLITIDLVEIDGRTIMTFRHEGLPTTVSRDEHRIGWNGAFDHLNEFVLKETSATASQEVTLSRTFVAPKDLVFEMWTKPEHIKHWFGPDGFTTTTHEMDFRVGGKWRFIMHGPDGTDYPNLVVYTEIVPTELIRYDHSDDSDEPGIFFRAKVTFDEIDGETTVTLNSIFDSPEALQAVMRFGVIEGGRQTLARLANYVVNEVKK